MAEETKIIDPDQIDLSGDGGVLKKILQEGTSTEKPTSGCKVSLHYTGTLTDGTKFDSSVDRNEPFEFELGKGRLVFGFKFILLNFLCGSFFLLFITRLGVVVKAFDLGIGSMKKGEKAILTCAPEYAYGASGKVQLILFNQMRFL